MIAATDTQRDYALTDIVNPTLHSVDTAVPTPRRRYVAVDLETTTLDRRFAEPLEIAAVEFDPLDSGVYIDARSFVPHHKPELLHRADPEALSVNRYYERRLYDQMLSPAETDSAAIGLVEMLTGATLVCANPSYDSIILWCWLSKVRPELAREPWHFRHYDVSLATAVELGLDAIPGLAKCAELWDISDGRLNRPGDWHTASYDAFMAANVCAAVTASMRARCDA